MKFDNDFGFYLNCLYFQHFPAYYLLLSVAAPYGISLHHGVILGFLCSCVLPLNGERFQILQYLPAGATSVVPLS